MDIQNLDAEIRKTDLNLALVEVKEIECGHLPAKTVAEAFSDKLTN